MDNFLETTRAKIRNRITELAPLVDEHNLLLRASEVLGEPDSDGRVKQPERAPERPRNAVVRQRNARGKNKEKILTLIAERPGASAGDVISATGITASVVYSALNRFVKNGELRMETLPSGVNGYRIPTSEGMTIGITTAGPPPVKEDAEPVYVTQEG